MYDSIKRISFEDCGVLGGRRLLKAGVDFRLAKVQDYKDLMEDVLRFAVDRVHQENALYPFERIGVVCILIDGTVSLMSLKGIEYYYIEDLHEVDKEFRLEDIGSWLWSQNTQVYQILQQIDSTTFTTIGGEYDEFNEEYGLDQDIYRCLELRGVCKIVSEKRYCDDIDHIKYELGEDFYIEAYNDDTTGCREFWIGRHFMAVKHLLASYDYCHTDYTGLLDNKGRLIIDQQIAEKICELSSQNEYFFIDNEYKLNMRAIGMEEIDMEMAIIREKNMILPGNDLLQ